MYPYYHASWVQQSLGATQDTAKVHVCARHVQRVHTCGAHTCTIAVLLGDYVPGKCSRFPELRLSNWSISMRSKCSRARSESACHFGDVLPAQFFPGLHEATHEVGREVGVELSPSIGPKQKTIKEISRVASREVFG